MVPNSVPLDSGRVRAADRRARRRTGDRYPQFVKRLLECPVPQIALHSRGDGR